MGRGYLLQRNLYQGKKLVSNLDEEDLSTPYEPVATEATASHDAGAPGRDVDDDDALMRHGTMRYHPLHCCIATLGPG
jgi:hypothetical protein